MSNKESSRAVRARLVGKRFVSFVVSTAVVGSVLTAVAVAPAGAAAAPATSPNSPASASAKLTLPGTTNLAVPPGVTAPPTTVVTIPAATKLPGLPTSAPKATPADTYTTFTHTTTRADGSATVEISAKPAHYQDASGAWHDIDTTLVAASDGSLSAKAAASSAKVAAKAGPGAVSVPTKAGVVTAGQASATAVAATAKGSTATFAGALSGANVAETVTSDGYEENVTIASPSSPASYTDQFTLPAGVSARNGGLGVEFVDGKGNVVASFGGVEAKDSAPGPIGGAIAPGTAAIASTNGSVVTVQVAIDPSWLADPARVFPVSLDPTMTTITTDGSSSYDGYVDGDYPASNYGWTDPEIAAGYAGPASSGGSYARSLLYFALGSLANSGAVVSDAHLAIDNQHSWVCNPPGSQINLVGVASHFDFSTTWSTQPGLDGQPYTTSPSFSYGDTCGGAGWVNLDATALVQRWLNGSEANNGLELNGVYQGNEMDNYGWKEFWSERGGPAPSLVINYTLTPGAPTNVVATAGNATATVSWARPTSAGSPALDSYTVYAYTYPGLSYIGSTTVGSATTSITGPATNGQSYVWAVSAHNSVGNGPATWSNPVTPAAPPGAPQNVVATSGSSTGSVRWVAPATNGGLAEDYYLVALYDESGSQATLVSAGTICGTCTFTPFGGMVNGHAYQVAIWGHNGPGGYGPGTLSNVFSSAGTDPMAAAGDHTYFSYQSFALDDRMTAAVNLGTGNLEVSMSDLSVPMVNSTLSVGRTYNSMEAALGASIDYSGQFGYLWSSNQTPDVRLVPSPDPGTVMLVSPTGAPVTFTGTNGASSIAYATPPSLDATLTRSASDGTYTLTVHASQEVLHFGADGQLLTDTDANGNALSFSYPDGRREATVMGTAGALPGNVITFTYNGPYGQVSSISQTSSDVGTRTVSYTYNSSNDAINQVTDASGRVTTFLYDASNNLSKITVKANSSAPDYQVTNFTYDANHRLTSVDRVITNPTQSDAVWHYDYTTPGQTKVTDADNHPVVVYGIDSTGRVTTVTDPKNNPKAATTTYTTDDKVATSQSAVDFGTGSKTTNTWSSNGESLTSTTDPIGAVVVNNFPGGTGPSIYQPNWSQDSLGLKTSFTYVNSVNVQQTTNTTNGAIALTLFNTDGTPSSSTDPNNITNLSNPPSQDTTKSTRYSYVAGTHQLQTITPPTGNPLGSQSFTYDGDGRLKTATSGKGVTTTYAYDGLDRVTGETFSDGTSSITQGYDALGNVISRADATGSTSWSYDTAGRLQSKTLPGGGVMSYQYDAVGNLTQVTDGGGTTRYHYDKVNELDQVAEPSGRYDVFAYDADHRRTDTWDGTPSGVSYDSSGNTVVAPTSFAAHIRDTYDPAGNLTEIRTTAASSDGNRLADIGYSYIVPQGTTCFYVTGGTATTMRQTSTDFISGAVTSHCYDAADRLTSAATTGGPTYTYGYDLDGNRISDAAGSHAFNTANQLTDTGYTYDQDGNLTASPTMSSLYNGIDQATQMTKGGTTTPFTYAGANQAERSSVGSTTAQNGALGVETETTGGATTTYVKDPSGTLIYEHTPASGDLYYYFDGLGSVIGLVNPTGQQRATYTYDPYGSNATAAAVNGILPPNAWRFAGGYLDASTGLYHFGARYYDPISGRWTQPDPIARGSCSSYDYVCGDPVNHTDPSGAICYSCAAQHLVSAAKKVGRTFACVGSQLSPFSYSAGTTVAGGAAVGTSAVKAARESMKFAKEAAEFGIEISRGTAETLAEGAIIVVGGGIIAYGGVQVYLACRNA